MPIIYELSDVLQACHGLMMLLMIRVHSSGGFTCAIVLFSQTAVNYMSWGRSSCLAISEVPTAPMNNDSMVSACAYYICMILNCKRQHPLHLPLRIHPAVQETRKGAEGGGWEGGREGRGRPLGGVESTMVQVLVGLILSLIVSTARGQSLKLAW